MLETKKNPTPISPMPLLENYTLLQALKLYAILLFLAFIPFIILAFVFFSIFFFPILFPALCLFTWALFIWKILFQYSTPSLVMVSSESVDESKTEKAISLELDSMEFPSLHESEEEKDDAGEEKLCKDNDSWQIQLLNSIKREEHKSFYEILTFWRRKERGEAS